ncbi:hypothetical protein ACFVTM_21015 [Arthrobacter sp. NPDC058130]
MDAGADIVIEVNVHDRAAMDCGLDAAVARMIESPGGAAASSSWYPV